MVKELRELTGAGMLDCKKALEATDGNLDKASEWLREKGISKAAKKADRIAAEGLVNILIEGNKAVIIEVNSETDFVAKNDEFKDLMNTISNLLVKSNVNTVEDALKLTTEDGTLEDTITNKIAKIGEKISFRRFELVEKSDNETFGSYIHMGGKIGVLVVLNGANTEVAKDVAMHAAAMRPKYLNIESVPAEDVDHEREIQKQIAINEGKPENIAVKMVEGRIKKFYKEVCLTEQPFVKDDEKSVSEYVKANGGSIVSMVRYEVGEGLQKKNENFAEEVAKQMNG
ncbi:MAG: elongation factor Ts [Bacilli bacterium]|nr:elongation factor Ts [Bacilli bacterium]